MRFGRRKPRRVPGEYPDSFVKGWMALTLPTTTPTEAASAVRHLRSKGWTEEKLAEFIYPYMPREWDLPPIHRSLPRADGAADEPPAVSLPRDITTDWLDHHLPAMDRRQLRRVVDELERRGWPTGRVAMAVLPHLLPKLPREDAQAILAGLAELGLTEEEIARATAIRSR